jgi:hypothetical protein
MLKNLSYLFIFSVLFLGCKSDPLNVDVSNVDVDVKFHRFDLDLSNAKTIGELKTVNQKLYHIGGELYEFYTIEMLLAGDPKDDSIAYYLERFVKDSMMQIVQNNINETFGDFKSEEKQIIDAFKHLKYHISHAMLPTDVITYNSTFANGVVSSPTQIGVGLEMYLGSDNQIIKQLPYPVYFKEKMDKSFLITDICQSWLMTNVIEDQSGDSFLSNLLYWGKIMYTTQAMIPDAKKSTIIKYTESEFEWAEVSEYDIWQFIVEQEWIYSKDIKLIVRYFKEGPTTVGLDGSPARIGQFLGWKIIQSYMDKNPEISIIDLIAEKNETKILKAYKPKKD